VVFDLDGTLLDSMPLVFEGLAAAVEPFRPRPDRVEIMGVLGGPSKDCVRRLLGGREHLAAALAAYLEFLRQHEDLVRPFRGVRTLLRDLRAAAVRLGIWTGRERESTMTRLRALSLDRQFDALVCGDDLASHKPDPAGLLQIIRRWRLAPQEVLFVGDSDQDLAGAAAAGVPMLAIHHHRRIAPVLLRHPLAVVATPAEACPWVRARVLASGE
jgi:HAD superfamily hydrolase (TIGR01509 family)